MSVESLEARTVPAFLTPVDYAGASPQAVVSGYFNSDTIPDVAVANYSSPGTVSVLLGNGDGTFQDAVASGTESFPYSLAVGDFNSDEDNFDDLVTVNGSGVSVLLGNGDGTFSAPSTIDFSGLGATPASVAVGDFNDDGNMDLGVTSNVYTPGSYQYYPGYGYYWTPGYYNGSASVLLGDGQGGFSAPNTTDLGYGYHTGVAVGDFDAGGKDDFAAINLDYSNVSVLLNDGAGNLQPPVGYYTGYYTLAVAANDVDGDGDDDLVSANYYGNNIGVLLSNGSGGFGVLQTYGAGSNPRSVATGDFNDDGDLDVIVANTSAVNVVLGRGDGTFSPAIQSASGAGTTAVTAGDFDGDGWLDAAVANSSGNGVSILINDETWPPANAPSVTVNNAAATEVTNGTAVVTFTVTLSSASAGAVTVHYTTANGSAAAGSDYTAVSNGAVTIPAGQTTATFTVTVLDDREGEPTETFVVNITSGEAFIAVGQGVGSIVDNEPRITINNVSKKEGNGNGKSGPTLFVFTVTLSAAYDQTVTVNFATANGSATTADNDYQAKTGTVTFLPGQTQQTITIAVFGDKKRESDEWFAVNLFDESTNAFLLDNQGIGTILDDDNRGNGR
jgi:hypothetical protein